MLGSGSLSVRSIKGVSGARAVGAVLAREGTPSNPHARGLSNRRDVERTESAVLMILAKGRPCTRKRCGVGHHSCSIDAGDGLDIGGNFSAYDEQSLGMSVVVSLDGCDVLGFASENDSIQLHGGRTITTIIIIRVTKVSSLECRRARGRVTDPESTFMSSLKGFGGIVSGRQRRGILE